MDIFGEHKPTKQTKYPQSLMWISFAGIGRADELLRCLGMPPPGHGRCGLARLRLALGPGGNARDDRAGPARPSPTDEPTRLPDALGCLSLLKRKAPMSGLQAAGLRRPIRFGPGLLILTDYDAVYAYHLREVRCARTHDPMRETSGGRPPRQPDPGLRTERQRAGNFFRRSIPDRNLESTWGSVLTRCQCRAIVQPRFDDCSMVAQIALKTESPRGLLSGPGPTRGAEAAEGAIGTGRVASNRRPRK